MFVDIQEDNKKLFMRMVKEIKGFSTEMEMYGCIEKKS